MEMGNSALVEGKIKDGEALLRELDNTGVEVKAAFWLYMPEPEEWRLKIAMPLVDSQGPRAAYVRIQEAIFETTEKLALALSEISVVSPKDQLVKLLKPVIRTGRGISGIRFSRNTINGTFIEDAYIYRIT